MGLTGNPRFGNFGIAPPYLCKSGFVERGGFVFFLDAFPKLLRKSSSLWSRQ
jgi:hypothetical protein